MEAMANMANQNIANLAAFASGLGAMNALGAMQALGGMGGLNAMTAMGGMSPMGSMNPMGNMHQMGNMNPMCGMHQMGNMGAMSGGHGMHSMGALGAMGTLGNMMMPACSAPMDVPEVVAGIESLYKDELKPYGRILRKRLAERASAAGLGNIDVDIKRLRQVCECLPWLCIQAEEGGDWSAVVRGRPANFIDVYSPRDLYSPEMWRAAGAYFASLDDASMVLPGGRYSCAQALAARNLPFLIGLSLGQVCHVVQLAISQKKLLGYLNGAVVPYVRSQSMVKERCAERGRPCTSAARGTSTLATWDVVRSCLVDILKGMQPGLSSIPLSNVKRLFRSRFHVELSETALGHSKLSELLQDYRLHDICTVRLQGHGYVVLPRGSQRMLQAAPVEVYKEPVVVTPPMPETHVVGIATPAVYNDGMADQETGASGGLLLRRRAHFVQPLSMEDTSQQPALRPQEHLPTVSPVAVYRSRSVPAPPKELQDYDDDEGCCASFDTTCEERHAMCELLMAGPPPPMKFEGARPMLTPSTLGTMGFSVHNTFIHAAMPPPTPPAGSAYRSLSLPRNMGSRRCIGTPAESCLQDEARCFPAGLLEDHQEKA